MSGIKSNDEDIKALRSASDIKVPNTYVCTYIWKWINGIRRSLYTCLSGYGFCFMHVYRILFTCLYASDMCNYNDHHHLLFV